MDTCYENESPISILVRASASVPMAWRPRSASFTLNHSWYLLIIFYKVQIRHFNYTHSCFMNCAITICLIYRLHHICKLIRQGQTAEVFVFNWWAGMCSLSHNWCAKWSKVTTDESLSRTVSGVVTRLALRHRHLRVASWVTAEEGL